MDLNATDVRKTYTAGSRSIDIADPTNAAQGYIYINFPIKQVQVLLVKFNICRY
jgi:hypothetical protein